MSFVTKQSRLRTFNKNPDRSTARRAMSVKMTDSFQVLKYKRELGRLARAKCLRLLGNRKFKLRKVVKSIRREVYND